MDELAFVVEPLWSSQFVGSATTVNRRELQTLTLLGHTHAAMLRGLGALVGEEQGWLCRRVSRPLNRLQERLERDRLAPGGGMVDDDGGSWIVEPISAPPWRDNADLVNEFVVLDSRLSVESVLTAIHRADERARASPSPRAGARRRRHWDASGAAELALSVDRVLGASDDQEGRLAASIVTRDCRRMVAAIRGSAVRLRAPSDVASFFGGAPPPADPHG